MVPQLAVEFFLTPFSFVIHSNSPESTPIPPTLTRIATPPADLHASRAARESSTPQTPPSAEKLSLPQVLRDRKAKFRKVDRAIIPSASVKRSDQSPRRSPPAAVRATTPCARFFPSTRPAPPEY